MTLVCMLRRGHRSNFMFYLSPDKLCFWKAQEIRNILSSLEGFEQMAEAVDVFIPPKH